MVIADLVQPVLADEGLEGVGGVIVGTESGNEVGLAVDLGVGQLVVGDHPLIVGGGNRRELIHTEGGQVSVRRPLGDLRIVIFHQDGGQFIGRCQHGIFVHYIGTGDRHIVDGDVVFVTEVLLDPFGPVVVFHVRHTGLSAVIYRDRDGHVLGKGFPGSSFLSGGHGEERQHHHSCQHQRKDLLHRGSSFFNMCYSSAAFAPLITNLIN